MHIPIRGVIEGRLVTFEQPYPEEILDKLTSYSIPNAFYMPLYHRWETVRKKVNGQWREVQQRVWDGKKHLLKNHQIPLGLVRAIAADLEKHGCQLVLSRTEPLRKEIEPGIYSRALDTLRDYQIEAFHAMHAAADCGGLVINATGTGKTRTAAAFFESLDPDCCLMIVDELTLLHQAREEMQQVVSSTVGMVGESVFEPKRVTVATIQTLWLHRNDKGFRSWYDSIRFMIIDEIHVQMNHRNFGIVQRLRPQAVYGLTATLELNKADVRVRAHAIAGPVLYKYPLQQGVSEGHLTPVVVLRTRFQGKPSGDNIRWNPYARFQFSKIYDECIVRDSRRNDLVESIVREAYEHGHSIIVLVERIEHLRLLEKRLEDLNPELVWGGKKSSERIESKRKFEEGETRLILTNKVFKKGVDIKRVDVGIDAAGMKSANDAVQKAGRMVRLCEGKDLALYFDISDVGNRFEKNSRSRVRAFQSAGIPVLKLVLHGTVPRGWWKSVDQKTRNVLKTKGYLGNLLEPNSNPSESKPKNLCSLRSKERLIPSPLKVVKL